MKFNEVASKLDTALNTEIGELLDKKLTYY